MIGNGFLTVFFLKLLTYGPLKLLTVHEFGLKQPSSDIKNYYLDIFVSLLTLTLRDLRKCGFFNKRFSLQNTSTVLHLIGLIKKCMWNT